MAPTERLPEVELSAEQILERVARVYSECKSYKDTGIAKRRTRSSDGEESTEWLFSTVFVRPDRFHFEGKEKTEDGQMSRYIVWQKGSDVRSWWDVTGSIRERDSLELTLAGATGVVGSAAHDVPALLLPSEIGGRRLSAIAKPKRLKDANLGDRNCFYIKGDLSNPFGQSSVALWIDSKTYLIRKAEWKASSGDIKMEESVSYDSEVNCQIADEALEFNPPEEE